MMQNPEKEIFLKVLAEPNQLLWEEMILQHCGHDAQLADRIRSLLQSHVDSDPELENKLSGRSDQETRFESDGLANDTTGFFPTENMMISERRIGRFRLERLAGRGGMGNVFQAIDESLQRTVALKVPRIESMDSQVHRMRFLREAQVAAKLNHSGLVEIYEVGSDGPWCFIASHWCAGGDLGKWLETHSPTESSARETARFFSKIAATLGYIHQQGVLHLDLKPANILLNTPVDKLSDASPKLTDFGIARVIESGWTETHSSILLGTPLYMSPEQIEGRRQQTGPASDIFSLGVILYEFLFGHRPLSGTTVHEVFTQLKQLDRLKLPKNPHVPIELRTICRRCLERRIEDRYESADELALDLQAFSEGKAIRSRPVSFQKRTVNWCAHPGRIENAGLIAIIFHCMITLALFGLGMCRLLEFDSLMHLSFTQLSRDIVTTILIFQTPSIIVGWFSLQRKRWSVMPGLLLGVFFAWVPLAVVVAGWDSPISLYQDNRLASLIIHLTLSMAGIIQISAYGFALLGCISSRQPSRR